MLTSSAVSFGEKTAARATAPWSATSRAAASSARAAAPRGAARERVVVRAGERRRAAAAAAVGGGRRRRRAAAAAAAPRARAPSAARGRGQRSLHLVELRVEARVVARRERAPWKPDIFRSRHREGARVSSPSALRTLELPEPKPPDTKLLEDFATSLE